MQDYRNLEVLRAAHQFTLQTYEVTENFPREEIYMLTNQVRRSAASIGYNLAEGCGMGTDPAFARYVRNAIGSASELDYQLLLSRDLNYLDVETYEKMAQSLSSIRRRLVSLLQRLRPSE